LLVDCSELNANFGVIPNSVLHVGGNHAEEAEDYEIQNWLPVYWIEPIPTLASEMRSRLDPRNHHILEYAAWDKSIGRIKMHLASDSMASSLLSLDKKRNIYKKRAEISTLEVTAIRLDELFANAEYPDFVNLDIQGAELKALNGMGNLIGKVKWIYCEVSMNQIYIDGAKRREMSYTREAIVAIIHCAKELTSSGALFCGITTRSDIK
jgi:FkbM family methyltransferase